MVQQIPSLVETMVSHNSHVIVSNFSGNPTPSRPSVDPMTQSTIMGQQQSHGTPGAADEAKDNHQGAELDGRGVPIDIPSCFVCSDADMSMDNGLGSLNVADP